MNWRCRMVALLLLASTAEGQTISTVAGGGTFGAEPISHYGMPVSPGVCMATDPQGRVYFGGVNTIERINEGSLTIERVAGTGVSGVLGNGGLATNATMDQPVSITIDGQGNIYFSSIGFHNIRRIDGTTGIITLYVGTTEAGYSGDNGPATAAKVDRPNALTTDASGNLYFWDLNWKIRKVDVVTKVITHIGGNGIPGYGGDNGPATAASFGSLIDISSDADGNLYIVDDGLIRKISASTGIVSTFAGSGIRGFSGDGGNCASALMDRATSVTINGANIYFMDGENHRIRKINTTTQTITTVAGNGLGAERGLDNGVGGPAVQARVKTTIFNIGHDNIAISAGGTITYYEDLSARFWRIAEGGNLTFLYGAGYYYGNDINATSASLAAPSSIALVNNSLFIVDQGAYRVRKIDLMGGMISDVAGIGSPAATGDGGPGGNAAFSNPFIMRADANGNLFVVDFGNHAIRRIDKVTGNMTTYAGTLGTSGFSGDGGQATSAKLNQPSAIAFDALGDLFIADRSNHRIRRVDKTTGIISTIAGSGSLGFSGDGGPTWNAAFNAISALQFAPNGDLLISDRLNHRVRKINSNNGIIYNNGIISTIIGNGTTQYPGDGFDPLQIGLDWPYGIVVDESENLYLADALLNRILRLNKSTNRIETVAGTGIASFSGDGGLAINAKLNFPRDIALDEDGALYIADAQNQRIRKVVGIATMNDPPVITGATNSLSTPEETALTISISNLTITDPDNTSADFSIIVQPGSNYSFAGTVVTPNTDFNGTLTVPIRVSDGATNSDVFNLTIVVTPVNDVPTITGIAPITAAMGGQPIELSLNDLEVEDPDNDFPSDFSLVIEPGDNYTVGTNTVTPNSNFAGELTISVKVSDGQDDSPSFEFITEVQLATGLESAAGSFLVSPNPTQGLTHLYDLGNDGAPKQIYLIDMLGRVLQEWTQLEATKEMDLHTVNPGIYIVKVLSSDGKVRRQRVIVTE